MPKRIEVVLKDSEADYRAKWAAGLLRSELKIPVKKVAVAEAFSLDAELNEDELDRLGREVFSDIIIQDYSYSKPFFQDLWRVEIGYRPGVTDNVGKTAREAVADAIGKNVDVYSSVVYAIEGELEEDMCAEFGRRAANELVQEVVVRPPGTDDFKPYLPRVTLAREIFVERVILPDGERELEELSRKRLLALSTTEMKAIKAHFSKKEVLKKRAQVELGPELTDVELEIIAQTWSEHCKHKIFNAEVNYSENGDGYNIDSLFKTFIKGATERIKKPYVISTFKDNGGIIKFDEKHNIAIKVETHNAPSALDPYGGALTGILGVNRDILGTGMGAFPIANTDVLCFGDIKKGAIEGVLHPKRIYEGVVEGIKDGGNKSGIPTVNGSITFDDGFSARPVIYCGTLGMMPAQINGRDTSEKKIEPGHLAVMVGGRVGKDGIHGATFSSQQLESSIPTSVVQIGDPITQKKMLDFVVEARDRLLYEAITDNGAGGLSSSIGEMAESSNGCEVWLEAVPLKYPGLEPWEIMVSESQERMTLAVKKENVEALEALAAKHGVEITVVGKFTASGILHALYQGKSVAYLDLDFLHKPPRLKLVARWKRKNYPEPNVIENDLGVVLKRLLASPNIASKEYTIRRYDHEVQGTSVIKPLMGNNAPCDAAVIRPILSSWEGIVISHGICPRYVQDSYDMAMAAFDEAVRNALAVGADFEYLAALDNFSWPDPVKSDKTPDGEYKMAQLVRACMGVYDCAVDYGVPIVSGKDSVKNDYYGKDGKRSIPPTLLITVVGKIKDVRNAISSDLKQEGDVVYVIGNTREEMGGSEWAGLFKAPGNICPRIVTSEIAPSYQAFSKACAAKLVRSAHDVSDGGLAVALAECAFPNALGIDVDLAKLRSETQNEYAMLFSESGGRLVVAVAQKDAEKFEKAMAGCVLSRVGRVRGDRRFLVRKGESIIINEEVGDLRKIWNGVRI